MCDKNWFNIYHLTYSYGDNIIIIIDGFLGLRFKLVLRWYFVGSVGISLVVIPSLNVTHGQQQKPAYASKMSKNIYIIQLDLQPPVSISTYESVAERNLNFCLVRNLIWPLESSNIFTQSGWLIRFSLNHIS